MGHANILIVEDDMNAARLVQAVLTQNGYRVSGIVASGEEAVDVALKTGSDLVLMNIRLKGEIDGIMACEQIRKYSDVPVIFVSGYTDADTVARAMRNRPSGYLTKPFRGQELIEKVENALVAARMTLPNEGA